MYLCDSFNVRCQQYSARGSGLVRAQKSFRKIQTSPQPSHILYLRGGGSVSDGPTIFFTIIQQIYIFFQLPDHQIIYFTVTFIYFNYIFKAIIYFNSWQLHIRPYLFYPLLALNYLFQKYRPLGGPFTVLLEQSPC